MWLKTVRGNLTKYARMSVRKFKIVILLRGFPKVIISDNSQIWRNLNPVLYCILTLNCKFSSTKSMLEILVKKCKTGFSKKTKSPKTLKKCPSDLWNCFQMPSTVVKNCKTSFQNTCSKFRFKKCKKTNSEIQFYMRTLQMSSNAIQLIESKIAILVWCIY